MEPNSPKKIQFAVPLFQSQLDPQAAEHIRKRRPTPATLVIYNDPNSSGRDHTESQRGHDEVRDTQHPARHAQPQLDTLSEEPSAAPPRRKDTPYQHQPPFSPGTKVLKTKTASPFPEEEETLGDQKDCNPN